VSYSYLKYQSVLFIYRMSKCPTFFRMTNISINVVIFYFLTEQKCTFSLYIVYGRLSRLYIESFVFTDQSFSISFSIPYIIITFITKQWLTYMLFFCFFFIILYCLTRLLTKHLRCPGKQK
jgi:hypothetical protein